MWFSLAERNTLQSACPVFLEFSQHSTFPAATKASDTHARIGCGQNLGVLTVLSWTVLLLCRQTNRLSSSDEAIHQTKADQPSPAGRCSLSLLLGTSSESGCATSGGDPAPEPPCLHRQSPKRLMSSQSVEWSRRCGELLMEPQTRHDWTSHPDSGSDIF